MHAAAVTGMSCLKVTRVKLLFFLQSLMVSQLAKWANHPFTGMTMPSIEVDCTYKILSDRTDLHIILTRLLTRLLETP